MYRKSSPDFNNLTDFASRIAQLAHSSLIPMAHSSNSSQFEMLNWAVKSFYKWNARV